MKCVPIVGFAIIAMFVSATRADYTPVFGPPADEVDHKIILDELYGGDFTASGIDYSSATITANRIHDELPSMGVLGVVDSSSIEDNADQLWHDGFILASAEARFAKYTQKFGYYENLVGGSYVNLFNVSGSGFNVTGGADLSDALVGKIWRWSRSGTNGPHSSLMLENSDGRDHLVTYRIEGLRDEMTTWLLFWEDLTLPDCRVVEPDFNDLVVEIKACRETSIPEPAGLVGALGAFVWIYRRP